MRNYLKLQGWYTDEEEQELRDLSRQQVLEALVAAEKIAPLSPDECAACPLALRLLAQDSFVQDLRGFEAERVLVCAVRMFDDVYDELPLHLQEQKEEVQAFRERFPDAFHGH